MSESKAHVTLVPVHAIVFGFFIAVKVAGTSFAAWSWWWLLLPIVPVLSLLVRYWGL